MTDFQTLSADIREDVGKGASRRLRHAGRVPAVIYGGDKDPVALTLEHREVWHAAENEAFFSSILEVRVGDGRTQQVVIRDMQRHPFKPTIMHIDFMRISEKEELRISLPLHFVGEEGSPAGKEPGVVIQHQVTEVEISALPRNLPEYIEVDLSGLEPGDAVMLADLTVPEGVTLLDLDEKDEDSNVMVANAVHISESQGTGAAAAAEAEAEAAEAAGEEELDADADAEAEDGDDAAAEGEGEGEDKE